MIRLRGLVLAPLLLAIIVGGGSPVVAQSPSAASSVEPGASPRSSGDPGVVTIADGEGFTKAYAYGAATGPDGSVVLVGEHMGPDPAIPARAGAWRSLDGTTWAEVTLPKSTHARSFAVAASALGWAAVGVVPGGKGLSWSSPDGIDPGPARSP